MKDRYESIEDYIPDEIEARPRYKNEEEDAFELETLKMKLSLKRIHDGRLRAKYRGRGCPVSGFSPCRTDDCELFDNDIPGLPWWGRCRLGRWPANG